MDGRTPGGWALALLLALSCGRTDRNDSSSEGASGPSSGGATSSVTTVTTSDTTGPGSGGSQQSGGSGGTSSEACSPDEPAELRVPKRLVRLSFNQLATSIRSLFGDALADAVIAEFELPDPRERVFPPLASPREGSVMIDATWQQGDAIAQRVQQYALENFAELSACGSDPSDECAEEALLDLASRAFRRPLEDDDSARLRQVYSEVRDTEASVEESFGYGVYALLSAPQYLYRTEFGTSVEAEERLTDYEIASQISYFITDGPPDDQLMQAADAGQLSDDDSLSAEVDRLLATSEAQTNLSLAAYALFDLAALRYVIVDPEVADFSEGLRTSMQREAELFLDRTLWNATVADLLLSRTSYLNEELASLYGVSYSGDGADAEGFAPIELPDVRAGLLTNAGFLTTRARVDQVSVVTRGTQVMSLLACEPPSLFPDGGGENVGLSAEMFAGASEREKMEWRIQEPYCGSCHSIIDPYGYALFGFDIIGRYRTTDPEGRPIDTAVTLADGTDVADARDLALHLTEENRFTDCLTQSFLRYALAEIASQVDLCTAQDIVDGMGSDAPTFAELMRAIAVSTALTERTPGQAP